MNEPVLVGEMAVVAPALMLLQQAGLRSFDDVMAFAGGRSICRKRGRSVCRFELGSRAFFLKRNRLHPVEFWKALSRGRWPSLGARREWENILAVQAAGIPTVTPVAVGERVRLGVETASFTLTEELYGAEPLERVLQRELAGRPGPARRARKCRLIAAVAAIARRLHGSGMWHQDLYLGHFLLGQDDTLYLIDLQRVGRGARVPRRYLVKDLGQLAFSAEVTGGLSRTDRLRFLLAYLGVERLRPQDKALVREVAAKAAAIARHTVRLLARRRRRGEIP